MEEYYDHFDPNFQPMLNIFPQKACIKNHNYESIIKNSYSLEKYSNSSDDERPKEFMPTQKSTKAFHEIFNITNEKNSLEQNQMFKIEENTNKEINNSLENNGQNNSSKENENISNSNLNEFHSGRWTNEEHNKFIEGILKYGNEWKKVQNLIKTRSSTQARSHAQKFFLRLKKIVNQETLNNKEKLVNYIINLCDIPKESVNITNEQKEKLMTVLRANLKAEEYLNKSEKEILNANNQSNSLNHKNESGFDDFNEDDDNLGYNKHIENEELAFKKKMSCDIEEKRRKATFCSRKRKSSSDLSIYSLNKIFTITKDKSHKNSLDITKSKNIFVNNLKPKDNVENNTNFYPKKFNINHNFIINKIPKITPNNNLKKNENLNPPINPNDFNIKRGNIIIQNNFYNIYNNFGNEINQNNNIMNNNYNQNIFINNNSNKINNYQNANLRTVIFNPDLKTSKKNNKKQNDQNNIYEDKCGYDSSKYLTNNQNLFPYNSEQDNNNKTFFENEQDNPFNLEFKNFSSNDKKLFNDYNNYNINLYQINEQIRTLSDKSNNLYVNE